MELTSDQKMEEFMPRPDLSERPKWLPDLEKMVIWMGMQHCAMNSNAKVNETRVKIRLKPNVGVFADDELRKDACLPVTSSTIFAMPRDKMQTASYHITDNLHVTPARPSVKTVDGEQHLIWSLGSASV